MPLNSLGKFTTVTVWGLGYLGYTSILKLQANGFSVMASDFDKEHLEQFKKGVYPTQSQIASWSRTNYIPKINWASITVTTDYASLFRSSQVHIIAMPESHPVTATQCITSQLAETFSQQVKKSKNAPLIIFLSAYVPGHIEHHFVLPLKAKKLLCGRHYFLGGLFRTDWNVERFINQTRPMPIGGYCPKSLTVLHDFISTLKIPVLILPSLKEAEIYTNTLNALQAIGEDVIRQLAFAYPSQDIRTVSELLFKHISFEDCSLGLGTGGKRMTFAIDYLLKGSAHPKSLALLGEIQNMSISSVLTYAEYLIRHKVGSVTILGLSSIGSQKDITLSPTITLADYLIKNKINVSANDPLYKPEEIRKLLKGVHYVDFPRQSLSGDAVIVASDHALYRSLRQEMISRLFKSVRLVIDTQGIWRQLQFGKKISYHCPGDGTLNLFK